MVQPEIRKVTHETHYDYAQLAECSQQVCVLQPQEGPLMQAGPMRKGQKVLNYSLKIAPNPSTLDTHTDYLGNVVTHFEINYPHDSLLVTSESEIQVLPPLLDMPPDAV
ncbi:MAG: transglutaminase N-terminal domain-containing protein, partial [Limnobacter sp.]|nr:transglutaminase N-terminal domain-containing protein [Limnobacter sp.]